MRNNDDLSQRCRLEVSQPSILDRLSPQMGSLDWAPPTAELTIGVGQIHVWRAWLDQPGIDLIPAYSLLSDDERVRVDRFVFENDRRRFVIRRALLRIILARYLGVQSVRIAFSYGQFGKPSLAFPTGLDIQFSLTHSHEIALFAITKGTAIGVDIERIRDIPEADYILSNYLHPIQKTCWQRLEPDVRTTAFLDQWTRTEACAKASGNGITGPVINTSYELSAHGASKSAELLDSYRAGNYVVRNFVPVPGYVASIAFFR